MRVVITVVEGPFMGRTFTLSGHDTFLVGRSKRAHFRLPRHDEFFSRLHFLVELNPPQCRLIDLDSTNGTYVNGEKVASADLRDGDRIQGGQTVLCVRIEQAPPQAEPVPEPALSATQSVPPSLEDTGSYQGPVTLDVPLDGVCTVCAAPAVTPTVPATWPVCPGCRGEGPAPSQAFPPYQLVREMGRGGMGVVYLALRRASGEPVALKTFSPAVHAGQAEVERFLREARILGQLHHPHIVAFHEMGDVAGQLFFVMDYVRGRDVRTLLRQEGPLAVGRSLGLACQLADALHHAHRLGFVHRDVKPANLMVVEADGRERLLVLDFGLARAYQLSPLSGLSLAGQAGGTLPFMAPEQITHFRQAGPPADQYSTAATLYNLLTGAHVHDFPRAAHQRIVKVLEGEPVPIRSRRADVPEPLAAVIHRALARDAEARYPDMAAFAEALRGALP